MPRVIRFNSVKYFELIGSSVCVVVSLTVVVGGKSVGIVYEEINVLEIVKLSKVGLVSEFETEILLQKDVIGGVKTLKNHGIDHVVQL